MLDATGKFPDGLLEGNFNALGSYSSCLEIEATPKYGPPFSGKFGGVQFISLNMDPTATTAAPNLLYGVCLPSSCTDADFYSILCTIDRQVNNVPPDQVVYGCSNRFVWIPHLSVAHERYHLEGGDIIMM